MKLVPVQTSFSAGELSPRMLGQVDTKGYKEGARILENMIALSQGPAARRAGFGFAYELAVPDIEGRIIIFTAASDKYFVLVFTPLAMSIFDLTGAPISPELFKNAFFRQGSTDWITVTGGGGAIVTFNGITCTLVASNAVKAAIRQQITGLTIGTQYTFKAVQLSPSDLLRLRVGITAGGAQTAEVSQTASVVQLAFTATAASHWFEIASMTTGATAVLNNVSVTDPLAADVDAATPFTDAVLQRLQFVQMPGNKQMFICSGEFPVQLLTFTEPDGFALGDAPFIAPPSTWIAGSYPRACTAYSGRLMLGGTRDQNASFWGSKSALPLDFTIGTQANDAFAYTLAQRCSIAWMSGGTKNLLIGTDVQEFVISASDGSNVVTPTNLDPVPQSAFGSTPIQPALLGNNVVYITADGRKVYSMGYRFEESGWVSAELTFAAEQMLLGRARAVAWMQNPEKVLLFITQEGLMRGATYDQGNKIVGWHKHPSEVRFVSIAVARIAGTDVAWALWTVVRSDGMRLQMGPLSALLAPGRYIDAHKAVQLPAPGTVFPGFQHLAGLTVDVLADDAVHPRVTVAADGSITLQYNATVCRAGLHCPAKLVTMPVETGSSPQGSQAAMKRYNKIFVKLLESARPLINGFRPPDRSPPSPMNLREVYRTETLFEVKLGWTREEEIAILEDLPVSLTVAAVFGEQANEMM